MTTTAIFVWSIALAWGIGHFLRYRRVRRMERACKLMRQCAQQYESIMDQEEQ